MGIKYVGPSGVVTGATDRAAIQAAIDAVTLSTTSRSQGTVVLVGGATDYYINAPLVVGDPADHSGQKSVNIVAATHARIQYVGDTTTDYMLTVTGQTYSPTPRLSGLYLDCASKCRGVHFRQTYMAGIENCMIRQARQVGLDFNSSWKAYCRNVHLWYCNGIALRVWVCNGALFDNLRIAQQSVTAWPDTDDTTVVGYDATAIQTAEVERAAMWIRSKDLTFRNLMFENNAMGSLPLVYVRADYARGVHFRELNYLESNSTTDCFYRLRGSTSVNTVAGQDFLFENIAKGDTETVPCVIKTTGHIDYLRVHGVRGTASPVGLTNVIQCDGSGSKLYRAEVKGARVDIAAASQIVGTNSGSIETGLPYGLSFDTEKIDAAP